MKAKILMAACSVSLAINAHGASIMDRLYLIGDIGPNFVQKVGFERIAGVNTAGFFAEVDPGIRGTVGVGYAFLPELSAELEGGFSYNETKTYSAIAGGVPLNGSIQFWVVPVTVGLTWRPTIPPPPPASDTEVQYGQRFFQLARPYIGGGVGAAEVFGDNNSPAQTTNPVSGTGRDTVLAYYAKAGITFPLNDWAEIGVQYRFHGNPGFTIKDTKAEEIYAHAVSLAVRIRF